MAKAQTTSENPQGEVSQQDIRRTGSGTAM